MTKIMESLDVFFGAGFEAYLLHDVDQVHVLPYPVSQAAQQMHGDQSAVITTKNQDDSFTLDAFISNMTNHFVGVRMADCGALLLADPVTGYYAAIHAGWRGTKAEIVLKTIARLHSEFGVDPQNLVVWIGPLACSKDYEVGKEVAKQFEPKYIKPQKTSNEKFLLDFSEAIYDQLIKTGVKKENISRDSRCTLTDETLPSARRQGTAMGKRMLAVITKVS